MTASTDAFLASKTELCLSWPLHSTLELPDALFAETLTREDLRFLRREQIAVEDDDTALSALADAGEVLLNRSYAGGTDALARLPAGPLVLLETRRGSAAVEIAATTEAALREACDALTRSLGAADEPENEVPVTFWAMGANRPTSARRRVEAPAWSDVYANYADASARAVGELITARVPADGRLILWHGEPGTGKTYALRALARAWGDWCSTHFITDPDSFLGERTAYLLEVLTAADSAAHGAPREWKLIVLEDAGELLSADARERTGQGLSRLLNTTDGLLGQGLKAIVLVTTNEPLRKLHPAVSRSGRCWAQAEFRPLSPTEANRWLAAHDSAAEVDHAIPLTDLYGLLRGRSGPTRTTFGFAA